MAATADMKQYLDQIETMKEEVSQLDPQFMEVWGAFSQRSKKAGTIDAKTKELICVALSLAARCSYCIASHVNKAVQMGASRDEIMEVSLVAVSMGGGPSLAYLTQIVQACDEFGAR